MNTKPLVSVIIPTYNRLELLKEAVFSVIAQNYKNIELVVVDDGSTDGTEGWCLAEMEHFPLKYIRIEHTGFPGRVRNVGVENSSGEYLAFLDSDDLWVGEKVEKQLRLIMTEGCSICHTRERWIRNGREISQSKQRHRRRGDIFEDALAKCIIGPSTVMLKREVFDYVGLFNEKMEIAEDYDLWLRVTALYRVCYVDEPLVIKRGGRPDQLSEKYGQIEIFRIEGLENFLVWLGGARGYFRALGWGEERLSQIKALAYRELARKCGIYANGCFKRGRDGEGRTYLEKVEKYNILYRQCSVF